MSLLFTKLHHPWVPPNGVLRSRLIERLNEGLLSGRSTPGVTLISAPAGFGKTTLIGEWIANCKLPVAWLSLDEGDSDPARFLMYLVAALQTLAWNEGEGAKCATDFGKEVLRALDASRPQPPPIDSTLTELLNEITSLPDHFILVLDDYHVIEATPIDRALTFLLDHQPAQMHLVITTREDPALPLARLRSRGRLTELRAADLRFTAAEAAEFLNRVMGLTLSAEDIAALENRTEGWIAGLQLAALAVQGALSSQSHQDIHGFIRSFAGDHRYIVDYLVEEVLQRQPVPIRNFLLQTAILDRLNGPLCDAVTGQEGGNARLEALQRGNFFVVPLDDKRHWYRYHHLFAEVLHMHLAVEQPDLVPALHRRASAWYEHHGSTVDAIRHALAAQDYERAAGLIESAVPAMRQSRQEVTVLSWLKTLPDDLFHCRPVLSVHYAGTLLMGGQIEGVESRLQDAERWLSTTADMNERTETPSAESFDYSPDIRHREMVVVDTAEFRGLPGTIAMYRAACALAMGDVANTLKYARRVLDLVPEDDHLRRGAAVGFVGLAYWTRGDLEAAHQSYADCRARMLKIGHVSDAIGCTLALADIRIAQGRLHETMSTFERGLQLATYQGTPALAVRGASDMHVGISELYRECNDLKAAMQHLLSSKELGENMGLPQNPYRWRVAMARIREAEGDLAGALDLLHEAERLYVSDYFPNVHPVPALKARVWVAQGRLGEALGWAREQGLSVEDDLCYLREFEHITLARILLVMYKGHHTDSGIHVAMRLLERLLKAAQEGGRTGSVVEILVLLALSHQIQGDISAALAALESALTLAEPEGYVRMFLDEGPPMTILLEKAAKHSITPNFVRQLLTALGKVEDRPPVNPALIEPLSERELEVLRLLRTDLSGPDLARELTVSLNTLRTHTKNIYAKLGVNDRRAALRRAEELKLV